MKRIGIAASKIAKDNLALYNFYVVLISCLFAFFIFVLAGATVLFSLILIEYLSKELRVFDFLKMKSTIFILCMVSLSVIVVVFNIMAIMVNIQFPRRKE